MAFCDMSASPVSTLVDGTQEQTVQRYVDDLTSISLILMSFALITVTIFDFKKRIRQMRMCTICSLLLTGFQIFLGIKFFTRADDQIFSVTAVFPIAAAILCFIAMRYIARDEALIMSASRLRSTRRK